VFFVCVCNLGTDAGSTETLTSDTNTISHEFVFLSRVADRDSTDDIADRFIATRSLLGVIRGGLSGNKIADSNVFSLRTGSYDLNA
jgi:hypothetical protein